MDRRSGGHTLGLERRDDVLGKAGELLFELGLGLAHGDQDLGLRDVISAPWNQKCPSAPNPGGRLALLGRDATAAGLPPVYLKPLEPHRQWL